MKLFRVVLLLAVIGASTFAQEVNVTANKLKGSATAPSGACSAQQVQLTTAGLIYTCTSGVWAIGGGGTEISQANIIDRTSTSTGAITGRRAYDAINRWTPAIHAVAKVAHGLAVLDPIYNDASGIWQKALATGVGTLPTGIVSKVVDADNFEYLTSDGEYTFTAHGLLTTNVYYLQNAGGLGTTPGTVSYAVGAPTGANTFQYYGIRTGANLVVGSTAIASGTNTRVLYDNAGVLGEYSIIGTGNVVMSASPTLTGTVAMAAQTNTGTIVQTSASATAFESGPNGSTNPVFRLVNSTASAATGISVTGAAEGSGVTVAALSSVSNEDIRIAPKGTGAVHVPTMVVGNTASGAIPSNQIRMFDGTPNLAIILSPASPGIFLNSGMYISWANGLSAATGDDLTIRRSAASVLRIGNGSTGAGSLVLGTSTVGSIGTSGVGVLAIANGTAPTSSPADEFQLYSADGAAGAAEAYARNEAGEINRLTGLAARNSSSFAKTSDTTLANITGLTRNVEASRTYAFTAVIQTTAAATGGVKFSVSGTATATAISYEGVLAGGAVLIAQTRATALDTTVCASTTSTVGTCTINGVITVANAGTLTVQFAQNTSDAGASTVLANQSLRLIPIN